MIDQILLSVDDAAAALSLGRSHLYELLASGEIQSLKVGRRRLVPVRALEAWMAQKMATATRPTAAEANNHGLESASASRTEYPLVTLRAVV